MEESFPNDWVVASFADIISDITSGDWGFAEQLPGTLAIHILRGTDFDIARRGDVKHVPIRYIKASSAKKRELSIGDILVELSGGSKNQPTGRILYINEKVLNNATLPIIFSNFVKRLRVDEICAPQFFSYYWDYLYLKGTTRIYEKRTTGIHNFKLNEFIKNETIPIAPMYEQKNIAMILSCVQKAIEVTEKVISATKELKKSLMQYLFTYGPVPIDQADQVPLKETEVGLIPEHWDVVRVGEIVRTASGGTPNRKKPEYYGGNIVWVKSGELNDSDIYDSEEKITEKGLAESSAKLFPAGTLLVAMYGATAGKVGLLRVPATTNQAICGLFPSEKVNSDYLFYAFIKLRSKLLSERYGGAQPNTSQTQIKSLIIPLPTEEEQGEIAHILRSIDQNIKFEERRRFTLELLFKSMLHHLMTGKIRVKDIKLPEGIGVI